MIYHAHIAILDSKAFDRVASSVYSNSLPIGMPRAGRLTMISNGLIILAKYCIVTSPSTVGLRAKMISVTLEFNRAINSRILRSSGFMPSSGFILPCNTWYNPLNSLILSMIKTSVGCSTTQMTVRSLLSEEQIGHGSYSVYVKHTEHEWTDSFIRIKDDANECMNSSDCLKR